MKQFDAIDKGRARRSPAAEPQPRQRKTDAEGGNARDAVQRERIATSFGAAAQRQGEEEELQMKPAQRVEDEELLQGRFAPLQRQAMEEEEPLQGRFAPVQRQAADNRTGMPDQLKSGVEALSGMDLSGVRVHANSPQPAQLEALAYAQGNDIHLAPGQEQHLPHEAWHVVQQRQGRVQPTMDMGGVAVNDDAGLEAEADAMGAKALRER